jgi:hypothetical protein
MIALTRFAMSDIMIYLWVCGAILPHFKRTNKTLKIFAGKSNIFLKINPQKPLIFSSF